MSSGLLDSFAGAAGALAANLEKAIAAGSASGAAVAEAEEVGVSVVSSVGGVVDSPRARGGGAASGVSSMRYRVIDENLEPAEDGGVSDAGGEGGEGPLRGEEVGEGGALAVGTTSPSAEKQLSVGLVLRGVGVGVLAVFTRPLSGALEVIAATAAGLRDAVAVEEEGGVERDPNLLILSKGDHNGGERK